MDTIAHYVHLGFLGAQGSVDLGGTAFWIAVLQIVLINVLLWSDNAVVIAMACRGLPPRQRFWGIAVGVGVSAVLIIVFAGIVVRLMALPYLKLIGGLALLYIAAKLLVPDDPNGDQVEAASSLWRAVRIIVPADVIMSFDNVIAIAAAGRGNSVALTVGLAVSIPIILGGAALVMALLNRFSIFIWAGAALLGWIAGEIIATDTAVSGWLTAEFGDKLASHFELGAAVAGAAVVLATGGFSRLLRRSKSRASAADGKPHRG